MGHHGEIQKNPASACGTPGRADEGELAVPRTT